MKTLLKGIFYFFITFTATLLALILVPVIYIGIISSNVSESYINQQGTEPNSILVWDISHNISDAPKQDDLFVSLFSFFGLESNLPYSLYLLETIDAITAAAEDPNIKEMLIHGSLIPENYGSELATLREVKTALNLFKSKGKKITAYMEFPTQLDYFLMSSADEIVMNPMGELSIKGLSSRHLYAGDFFKQYGIGIQTTREGKYKSAVEMFTRSNASNEDKEQSSQLLTILWEEILKNTAKERDLNILTLQRISDTSPFLSAEDSQREKLVDRIGFKDEIIDTYTQKYGKDTHSTFKQVSFHQFIQRIEQKASLQIQGLSQDSSEKVIAVVYVEGEIVNGNYSENAAAGEAIAMYLRKIRNDKSVKAAVLRINSPGGSAYASEIIYREAKLFAEKKPLIVSMGNYAASGGYWIATAGNEILADESTITGSIGVFGIMFDLEELAKRHGITFDGTRTSVFADIETISRPKTEAELRIIQRFTDNIYERFLEHVSESRNIPVKEVKQVAEGRVWAGNDAKKHNLVNKIGGLNEAILLAAEKAGLKDNYYIDNYPHKISFSELILTMGSPEKVPNFVKQPAPQGVWGKISNLMKDQVSLIEHLDDPRNVYARLPFSMNYE